ncbi:hypothetical protein F2P81_009544 [Scophthalmus maximus]|uniref:Uncharacterized protein n=1 Tax=Scophthalmus maximus TaxID=52904 RepID=A0A6A4T503_SCOMX|nr:hypothetical protein F2P81_009544 [Scophthalmus maximus]
MESFYHRAGIHELYGKTMEIHNIHTKRTTVLHALPVYLREDVSGFFRTCSEIHNIHTKRTTVLHALPVYLREDVSGFFRTCSEIHNIHTKRTTVLHALPVYLREDVSGFFRTCSDESDEPELHGVAVGLLTIISDHDTSPVHYHPVGISVVIESDAMISLPRLGDAFLVIFGLLYALHPSYPKALTNTFEFTKVLVSA